MQPILIEITTTARCEDEAQGEFVITPNVPWQIMLEILERQCAIWEFGGVHKPEEILVTPAKMKEAYRNDRFLVFGRWTAILLEKDIAPGGNNRQSPQLETTTATTASNAGS